MTSDLEQALGTMIRSLVDRPEDVRIERHVTEHVAQFEVHVFPGDFGKLLGKKGVYANSLRRVFSGAFGKQGKSFNLHIVDPRRSDARRS